MKDVVKAKGQLRVYLAWPLLLSLFVVLGNIVVALVSRIGALALAPFTLGYLIIAFWIYIYRRRRVLGGLVEYSSEYAWIQKQLITDMALPYALSDEEGRCAVVQPCVPGSVGSRE